MFLHIFAFLHKDLKVGTRANGRGSRVLSPAPVSEENAPPSSARITQNPLVVWDSFCRSLVAEDNADTRPRREVIVVKDNVMYASDRVPGLHQKLADVGVNANVACLLCSPRLVDAHGARSGCQSAGPSAPGSLHRGAHFGHEDAVSLLSWRAFMLDSRRVRFARDTPHGAGSGLAVRPFCEHSSQLLLAVFTAVAACDECGRIWERLFSGRYRFALAPASELVAGVVLRCMVCPIVAAGLVHGLVKRRTKNATKTRCA